MRLWYITGEEYGSSDFNELHKMINQKIENALIFCVGDKKSKEESVVCVNCEDTLIKAAMNKPFYSAWEMWQTLLKLAEIESAPDVICFDDIDAIGTYLLQSRFIDAEIWRNCVFIFHERSKSKESCPQYLLPYYWIKRQNAFCEKAAHKIFKGELCSETIQKIYSEAINISVPKAYPFLTKATSNMPLPSEEFVKGMLTVILPYYNMGKTLPETLKSILSQGYKNLQIILIDDGSTDEESIAVLNEMEKFYSSIQVIRQENKGLAAVRNLGVNIAKGEFVTYIDSDDIVCEGYFQKAIETLNYYDNAAYVSSWLEMFGEAEGYRVFFSSSLPELMIDNMQGCCSICRTAVIKQYGRNLTGFTGFEDHEYWINLAENGFFGICIPKPYVKYRISKHSMSGTIGNEKSHYKQMMLYQMLSNNHPELYKKYGAEIFNLLTANGPGYLWDSECTESGILRLEKSVDFWHKEFELAREHIQNLESSKLYKFKKLLRFNLMNFFSK